MEEIQEIMEEIIETEKENKREIETEIQMMKIAMTKRDIETTGSKERNQVLY
jgi:hypothetical protein